MNKRLRKKMIKKLLASPMTEMLDWAVVLRSEPEKAAQCPVLKKLDGVAWWWILIQQPQLDYLCNWKNFKGYDWAFLLGFMPQYADKCRWNKLEGADWRNLLLKQPQFAKFCNFEKLGLEDCEKLLEPESSVDDIAKAKITERLKQFNYRIGFLDGYWHPDKKSQCARCRFLSTCNLWYQCFFYLDEIPYYYLHNMENCPHRANRKNVDPSEIHKFAERYAKIFQDSPTAIHCEEFFLELLLHSFKVDITFLSYDPKKIHEETDINTVISIVVTLWIRENNHDFAWFASALLHLAKLTSEHIKQRGFK